MSKDGLGPVYYLIGETCQFSNMDSVAAIGAPSNNLSQKQHLPVTFLYRNTIVRNPFP